MSAKTRVRDTGPPRLLPAIMVTLAVLIGLKAVAFAEGASTSAEPAAAKPPQKVADKPASAAPSSSPAAPPAQAASCPSGSFAESAGLSPSEVQVLQSLGARREALDARAADLDTRQELIAAAERRVEERLAELKRIEAQVQAMTKQVDDTQNQRVLALVDVYQRMRAKDAAAVFDALDQDVLVSVASHMRQANLAEIMGKMQPARARVLTQWLAAQPSANQPAAAPASAASSAAPAVRSPANARK